MERIFSDQSFQSLLLYLDDVIIFSTSVEQHLQRLEMVLKRLQRENLKMKLSKCCFFQQQVKYLGHVVSADGVATKPDKIAAVAKWKCLDNVQELISFIGFASYYKRFVPGFSQIAILSVTYKQPSWEQLNRGGLQGLQMEKQMLCRGKM